MNGHEIPTEHYRIFDGKDSMQPAGGNQYGLPSTELYSTAFTASHIIIEELLRTARVFLMLDVPIQICNGRTHEKE